MAKAQEGRNPVPDRGAQSQSNNGADNDKENPSQVLHNYHRDYASDVRHQTLHDYRHLPSFKE